MESDIYESLPLRKGGQSDGSHSCFKGELDGIWTSTITAWSVEWTVDAHLRRSRPCILLLYDNVLSTRLVDQRY